MFVKCFILPMYSSFWHLTTLFTYIQTTYTLNYTANHNAKNLVYFIKRKWKLLNISRLSIFAFITVLYWCKASVWETYQFACQIQIACNQFIIWMYLRYMCRWKMYSVGKKLKQKISWQIINNVRLALFNSSKYWRFSIIMYSCLADYNLYIIWLECALR